MPRTADDVKRELESLSEDYRTGAIDTARYDREHRELHRELLRDHGVVLVGPVVVRDGAGRIVG